jgi:hypothetical protein
MVCAFPAAGARVRLSRSVMTGLARRQAFAEGPVTLSLVPDPRAIALEGDRFVMDLRLWRLAGRGWWQSRTRHCHLTQSPSGGRIAVLHTLQPYQPELSLTPPTGDPDGLPLPAGRGRIQRRILQHRLRRRGEGLQTQFSTHAEHPEKAPQHHHAPGGGDSWGLRRHVRQRKRLRLPGRADNGFRPPAS